MAWVKEYPELRERFAEYLIDMFPGITSEDAVVDDLCEIVHEVLPGDKVLDAEAH